MAEAAMRVRHLVKGLGPGGAERLVAVQVASPTDRIRYDVGYLLEYKDHLVAELGALGTNVRCLDARRITDPRWMLRLRRWLLDDPVDVLHLHSPAVAALARLVVRSVPRRHRPAVVGTEHNRWPRHHPLTRLANSLTLGLQDGTIAVSGDVRQSMSTRHQDSTVVVEHGIDLATVRGGADRDAARDELGVRDDEVLVMCVANLRREKALEVLVEVAASTTTANRHLRFALIGQGPLEAEITSLVTERGLGERFSVLGYRDDVTRLLSAADVFTLTSRHEGLPVAVMEALALGLPIVATAAGGVADAVGDAGTITAVDDVAALCAAHLGLAENPNRRHELSKRALRRAEHFSAERAVAEIEQVYAAARARCDGARRPSRSA